MPKLSKICFRTAILFLIAGISIGIAMHVAGQFNVTGAHAHANLLGWVTMALFGTCYALRPPRRKPGWRWSSTASTRSAS